jgi:transcriptional regulator with XRE-family HTH domain
MDHRAFAEFLRSRRERIRPADVGLPVAGRRRTPGLRRAEVAQLAGISPDYYIRLEQGRNVRPSPSVLDALARALRLDEDERGHLYLLARSESPLPRRNAAERVQSRVRRLVEVVDPTPAFVINTRMDVLAWNRMAAALCGDFAVMPPGRRNLVWRAFCDPASRTLYVDWESAARQAIAHLRAAAGQDPDDPTTQALIGELSLKSPEFRRWWARHDVAVFSSGRKELLHPTVGRVVLDYQSFQIPNTPDQQLVMYTAPASSPSQDALDLLAMLTHDQSVVPTHDGQRPPTVPATPGGQPFPPVPASQDGRRLPTP